MACDPREVRTAVEAAFHELAPLSALNLLRAVVERLGLDPYRREDIYAVQDEMRRLLESGVADLGASLHFTEPRCES